jgi:hypothetical protein
MLADALHTSVLTVPVAAQTSHEIMPTPVAASQATLNQATLTSSPAHRHVPRDSVINM